jgi:tetratricopeptide (TPR) repeat protein
VLESITDPSGQLFVVGGVVDGLDRLGNYTEAIQYYDKALAIDPKYFPGVAIMTEQ